MTDNTAQSIGIFKVGDHVRLRDDADGKALHVGDRVMLAPGGTGYYTKPEELVHAPAGEDAPDAGEEDAPEEQPEPVADVPRGLAGLRKLAGDVNSMPLWNVLKDGTEPSWDAQSSREFGSLRDTLARLAGEAEAERKEPATAPQLPEGVEWPRYEDGTPVRIGDEAYDQPGGFAIEVARVAIRDDQWYLLDLDGYDISWGGRGDHPRRYVAPTPDLQRPDTWDQLRKDATLPPESYCDRHDVNLDEGWEPSDAVQAMALDVIDRAERLAKGGE